ncbi:MAG: primase C-terminal domain-containing protein [Chloroflexi bacterium]|nr:primase C-terminal domain-containing protein [Chloroflexota bacterium]
MRRASERRPSPAVAASAVSARAVRHGSSQVGRPATMAAVPQASCSFNALLFRPPLRTRELMSTVRSVARPPTKAARPMAATR